MSGGTGVVVVVLVAWVFGAASAKYLLSRARRRPPAPLRPRYSTRYRTGVGNCEVESKMDGLFLMSW